MVRCQSLMLAIKQPHDDMKLSSLKCNVSSNQCATQNRDDVVLLVVQMQVHKDTLHGITLAAQLTGKGGSLTNINTLTS